MRQINNLQRRRNINNTYESRSKREGHRFTVYRYLTLIYIIISLHLLVNFGHRKLNALLCVNSLPGHFERMLSYFLIQFKCLK